MRISLIKVFLLLLTVQMFSQQEARLLRFPAIHGEKIAFSYAGDLYIVNAAGGVARKITSDIGYEMFPKFSPDGKYIAFTGQYDGNTEVYLIPAEGGIPKRLTYTATLGRDDVSDRMGPNNIVMAWKDNETIMYRSRWREFNDWKGQLYTVSIKGGLSEQLPLPRGGFGTFNSDGTKLVYNRVFREFRTWKRYRGGQADDIWIYDLKSKKTERVLENPAQDIFPMWVGDKIYFTSDRNNTLNLYVHDIKTNATTQLTKYTDFDVKFPSAGSNAIVYENGGYIYKYEIAAGKAEKVTIYINEDFAVGRNEMIDVSREVSNFEISPDGNRAMFGARGEIFTVPVKNGPTRNITGSMGVHERASKWSPDGRYIAYISDRSGEDEIYIKPQNGLGDETQLTKGSSYYKFSLIWSSDSKKILFHDQSYGLFYVDIESKKTVKVDQGEVSPIGQYDISPDGYWIAYSKNERDQMSNVYLYSVAENKSYKVTDGWFASGQPEFSEDGSFLYFVSSRTFNPRYGWTEWNHIYVDMAKIYMVPLAKSTKSPFEPKSDEVTIKSDSDGEKGKDDKKNGGDAAKDSKTAVVDTEGLTERIIEVPVQPASYFNLASAGDKLFYQRNSSSDSRPKLLVYDFKELKETDLGEINGYEISADGKKMLVSQNRNYAIIPLPSAPVQAKEFLNLSDMKVMLDRKAEWKQIYTEAWRQMRDFFYDKNMHGVDWKKEHDKYAPLVEYVNHRADLSYIIGELIGELNAGHAYVGGGDYPKAERIGLGLLGAELKRDNSGYYQIKTILKGQNWDKSARSPLTESGVNISEGEYIIRVDGRSTKDMNDIYESLVGKAEKQVTLTVNSKPGEEGARDVVVIPVSDEQNLYYLRWIEGNIKKVSDATDGRVGYIHIPDMGVNGLNWFAKYFYPQLRKEALIIDDRGNGGGNVSPQILERLNRELVMMNYRRNGTFNLNPSDMHLGPKVLLMDEFSASDGDIFPYRFRANKLGKLIGKRSWGGVVGIAGTLPFTDGGYLNKPEFAPYDIAGKNWIMEGYGVDPDIVVDNDPALEFEGTDQQLNKAIEVIKEELKNNPPKMMPPPPFPDKSK